MKKKTFIFAIFLAATLMLLQASGAMAHYVWLDPSGQISEASGNSVSVDVYLHAEELDTIYGWGLNVGFDDTVELNYQSYTYGAKTSDAHSADEGQGYDAGTSLLVSGESVVQAGRYDWNFNGDELAAGDDYLLFTVNFTFVGGVWDGDDVWVEWGHPIPGESYFDMESAFYDTMTVHDGPDYAAVPIPTAAWLLGSGLLGLIGARRRSTKQ